MHWGWRGTSFFCNLQMGLKHAHRDAMLSGPFFFFDSSDRWGKGRESEAVDKRLSKLKW